METTVFDGMTQILTAAVLSHLRDQADARQAPRDGLRLRYNVEAVLRGADGEIKQVERSHNIVTDVGCAHIADQLESSPGEGAMSHMAIGTGATAPAAGDTTLQTELDRNALTSFLQGGGASDHQVVYIGDWAAGDGTGAITEAGVFNDPSAGTLLMRTTFSVVNKGASDTLQITWTLSVADDGA
jgi:hypothetical protein